MKIQAVSHVSIEKFDGAFACPLFKEDVKKLKLPSILERFEKDIRKTALKEKFEGKKSEILSVQAANSKIILLGLGEKSKFSVEILRQAIGTLASSNFLKNEKNLILTALNLGKNTDEIAEGITEGLLLSRYSFKKYKTEKNDQSALSTVNILLPSKEIKTFEKSLKYFREVSEAVFSARDLVSHPSNTVTPSFLANHAKAISKKYGLKLNVLTRKDAEKLGMNSFLSVAKGSDEEPKFIVLEYGKKEKGKKTFCFIGKGITFDSGGISLKPGEGMEKMKYDMAGAAAVLGTMEAVGRTKPHAHIVGIVPATENMPSGKATKPGDIVKALNGKTIEIINTDAEGRLVLADALSYAERYKPDFVVDLATLTGACLIALGNEAMSVVGFDEALIKALIKAGNHTYERVWQLPLFEEYGELIKSDIADIKNIGGRYAGAITGGFFLSHFASKFKWAHLDIAGVAWTEKDKPYIPKGATGVGVRLLMRFLKEKI